MATASLQTSLSVRGGLHVPAARLWLDGDTRRGIGFLAQFDGQRRRRSRVLCSPVVAALLGQGGATPLAVPYGRPFQLGPVAVELLPGGASAGSALLRTHIGEQTYLFAGAARLDTLPTAEPLALREADVLVLDAQLAETQMLSAAELQGELTLAQALVQGGVTLVWLLEAPTLALDVLAWADANVPVWLAPSLARLVRRFRQTGGELPPARAVGAELPAGGLVLWPLDRADRLPPARGDLRRWLVAERAGADTLAPLACERGLAFSRRSSGTALDELARRSGAAHVAAYGAGAPALCARLRLGGLDCSVLGQAQLRLV